MHFLSVGIVGGVNTDLDKIYFALYMKSQVDFSQWEFFKIFPPIRIRETMKLNSWTCCPLESTEETAPISRKSILAFISSHKSIFFSENFLKFFDQIRIREKIKFNYSIFLSLESTDEWTLMLKKFYWPLLYSRNRWENIFLLKIFRPIRIREKIKFNYFTFSPLESRDQWTPMLKKSYWLLFFYLMSVIGEKKIIFSSKFFDRSDCEKKSNSINRSFAH